MIAFTYNRIIKKEIFNNFRIKFNRIINKKIMINKMSIVK